MFKVFLGGVGFDEIKEEDEEMVVVVIKDGEEVMVELEVKYRKDLYDQVKQVIFYKVYGGLVVLDQVVFGGFCFVGWFEE